MNPGVVVSCASPLGSGGLGRHLAEVVAEERATGRLRRYFAFAVPEDDPLGEAIRLRWSPWLGRCTPVRFSPAWKAFLAADEFDRSTAARLPAEARTFIGFAGMALHSFRRARRLGYSLLQLESPTAHVQHVRACHERAYRAHPLEGDWLGRRQLHKTLHEYEHAEVIVVNSEFARQTFLAAGVPASKLRRRMLTVDPRFRPSQDRAGRDGFGVVYVGSLTVAKGVPVLLEAFAGQTGPRDRLTLVGGSGSRGMRRYLAAALARERRIRICVGDPLPHLWEADVLVHPSYQDGFGYAPMEALACGLPVIVTDQTGMKEHVREGQNGYVVPAGDVEALADRLAAVRAGALRGCPAAGC